LKLQRNPMEQVALTVLPGYNLWLLTCRTGPTPGWL
jgi:hypothetical protein